MSTSITFPLPDGATYIIPAVDDENWGQNVTNFLLAIPGGVPPRNGTFALTGDLAFGPSFGLISQYYKSPTSNIAHSGIIRLAKTDSIDWRNNANSADLPLTINGSDQLTFNGAVITGVTPSNLTDAGTDGIVVTGGTGAVLTSCSLAQHVADASHNGYLSSTDWSTFNGKQSALNTLTAHDVLVGSGSNVTLVSPSTSGLVLTSSGVSSDPAFKPSGVGNVGTLATSGTVTPDASTANTFSCAVSGAVTLNGPSNGVDGQKVTLRIINDASHSVSLATGVGNYAFGTDITSYTNSVSLTDYIGIIWNTSANRWHVVSIIQGF